MTAEVDPSTLPENAGDDPDEGVPIVHITHEEAEEAGLDADS